MAVDLVSFGEVLIDMFPAEIGRRLVEVTAFHPKPGGAPANVAVAAARLGASAAFIGKVGDDIFGHFLAEVLEREGVITRGMCFDPDARTTMAIIALPDVNTAEFIFYRNPGADTRLRVDELDCDLLQQTRVFHCGSLSLTHEPARGTLLEAVRIVHAGGARVSFDANFRPSLWPSHDAAREQIAAFIPQVDVLKVNEVELELLTGTRELDIGSQALLQRGPKLVVVTLGPEGSYFRSGEGAGFVPTFRVETVDATGCGDAFIAALLVWLVRHDFADLSPHRLQQALRFANAAGALTATQQGVIPALPTAAQVEAFLRTREEQGQ